MLSRRRGGGTMKPSASPGATFFDRLSSTMQRSGASAASGRFVVEKAVDGILDDGEVELLDDAQQVGAARRRHGHAKRILNRGLNVERRQMRFAMGLLHRVRPYAVLVHRQRHQRDAEPRGDALDEGIGQSLDAAAAAGRHHRGECGRDALPAVRGEDDAGPGPVTSHCGRDTPPKCVLAACVPVLVDVSQRGVEHFRPIQPLKAFRDHRRLVRQQRIVEFQIDACAARLGRRGDTAPRFAGNERAASDFADHKAAAQQLGIDPARGRDGDLALIGEVALRRQAIAGFERAIGDLGGNGIGKLQIFEFRHYCTESNVLLAPRHISDHLRVIKPAIELRRAQAIRGQ